MPDLNELNDLQLSVKSRILARINDSLAADAHLPEPTMYTKSDGTNYGMYQKAESVLTDIWDTVINQRSVADKLQSLSSIAGIGRTR